MSNDNESLFELPETPLIPVLGSDKPYPVNRIFCVGRNYEAHAVEMGVAVDREAPFYFTKSPSAIVHSGAIVPYPPETENYHHEMEFVFVIGKSGFKISVDDALDYVYGYASGLDMTRRDLQLVAREKGRPWDLGKDFEQSAVISPITQAKDFASSEADIAPKRLSFTVNGETKQDALLETLIWKVQEIIAHLSKFYHLAPGDVIYTGTPAGVGPVLPGDVLHGEIEGLAPVDLTIGEPEA
jgi:fumarylpyruvate hydrolase